MASDRWEEKARELALRAIYDVRLFPQEREAVMAAVVPLVIRVADEARREEAEEWERLIQSYRAELRAAGMTGSAVAGICDEILRRRGVKR